MELYLRWLAKYEQESDENPPLGIYTLRTGKTHEQIELLALDKSGCFLFAIFCSDNVFRVFYSRYAQIMSSEIRKKQRYLMAHGVSLSLGSSFSIYNRGVANQLY